MIFPEVLYNGYVLCASVLSAMCYICAMCYVLCAMCYVLCAMCYALCANCYVLCLDELRKYKPIEYPKKTWPFVDKECDSFRYIAVLPYTEV